MNKRGSRTGKRPTNKQSDRDQEYVWLVKPVIDCFERQWNLPVIAIRKQNGGDLHGSDEFGISMDNEDMRVDVLGFNWDAKGRVATKAVEAKLIPNSPARSIDHALGQAINYQVLFDEVYVAVESGGIGAHRESVLSDLGLGWLSVDKSGNVKEQKKPEPRKRFDRNQYNKQVLPRLLPPLVFLKIFRPPIKYGITRHGGIYVAKEPTPKFHIQINAWFDPNSKAPFIRSGIGFNIEHKDTFRAIIKKKPDLPEVSRILKELAFNNYEIALVKVPNPHYRGALDVPIDLTDKTDSKEIFRKIKQVLPQDSGYRPHLAVFKEFLPEGKDIKKDEALQLAGVARTEINPISEYFSGLFI